MNTKIRFGISNSKIIFSFCLSALLFFSNVKPIIESVSPLYRFETFFESKPSYNSLEKIWCDNFWSEWRKMCKTEGFTEEWLKNMMPKLKQYQLFRDVNYSITHSLKVRSCSIPLKPEDSIPEKFGRAFFRNAKFLEENPKTLGLEHYSGQFESVDKKKIGFMFFKGHGQNKNKLIIICGGLAFPKMLSMPYIISLSGILGYSTAIFDYRGHYPDHDQNSMKNPLFRFMQKATRQTVNEKTYRSESHQAIDSSKCTFGLMESIDLHYLVKTVKNLNEEPFEKTYALGTCFGASVVSWAQSRRKIFDGIMFISPFGDPYSAMMNIVKNKGAFLGFFNTTNRKKIRHNLSTFYSPQMTTLRTIGIGYYNPLNQFFKYWVAKKIFLCKNIPSYIKFFQKLDVPCCYLNSRYDNYSDQNPYQIEGDSIITQKLFQMILEKIDRSKSIIFWSSRVRHLQNWAYEAEELVWIFAVFFSDPAEVIKQTKRLALMF